ncbi:MAG TPA: MBL fold metallo-hydrolase [Ignavibacteria bacterium]|nr:MBL fold metallo-hydrolase [Ignavibacteria bacterium]
MKVIQLPVNPFQMNCYIYYDENTGEGIIIDPAVYFPEEKEELKKILEKEKIKITKIINTHGHLDHILGNKFSKELFNVELTGHKDDELMIKNSVTQGKMYGVEVEESPAFDSYLAEGDDLKVANASLRIIHTPGHSPGSICLIDDKNKLVFCGDVIFKESIGRTDLPGGDYNTLIDSIKNKLFKEVTDEYQLLPGHMETTDVGYEKMNNPFLK